ncbi:MAG: ABC transporter permease [Terriglobales bacterium]
MRVPLTYNTRNLRLRLGATVMTALGIALTVAVAIMIMALLAGLRRAFVTSGDPLNVLAMRKGAEAEMSSYFMHEQFNIMRTLPEVARGSAGQPLVSGELVVAITLPRRDGSGEVNVTTRGMMPTGLELRPRVTLVEGRWWETGKREIVVSRSIHERFANADIGRQLRFGKGLWNVVGIFDAGGSAYESELWGDVHQMASDFDRPRGYSSALLRAVDRGSAERLRRRMSEDQRLTLNGLFETDYYAMQTRSGAPIQYVGTIVAFIMAVGSCFAAMNTMYAAVAYRGREIATLRTIGFSRPSILASFLVESVLLSLIGGVAGVLLMLPFNGLTTGTSNQVTFSEIVFAMRITPNVVATALAFAVIMGVIGGMAPAWHAARRDILAALRD